MKINIFQQVDAIPKPESMGSIFPLVPPLKVNVKNKGRVEFVPHPHGLAAPAASGPTASMIQDLDVETVPELRHRLRIGYLGPRIALLPHPVPRFARARVAVDGDVDGRCTRPRRTFPSGASSRGKPLFASARQRAARRRRRLPRDAETYRDFEFQMYVRHVRHHNGGVIVPAAPAAACRGRRYEVQLHDVEGAHYATGSLYSVKRASYPRIEPEQWWLFQLRVKDNTVLRAVQRRHGAGIRPAGVPDSRTDRVAGAQRRPLDPVQANQGAADLERPRKVRREPRDRSVNASRRGCQAAVEESPLSFLDSFLRRGSATSIRKKNAPRDSEGRRSGLNE